MSFFNNPLPSGVDVPFNATDFGATGAMTWTVAVGDVSTYRYSITGKMMTIVCLLETTTVGGTVAGNNLTIKMPNGVLSAKKTNVPGLAAPGGAATEAVIVNTAVGSNLLTIVRFAANWVAGADNTTVGFQIVVEIQ